MKSFFSSFRKSANEFTNLRSLSITGIFIAMSVVLESVTINTPYFKISFAYLAAACIGMLFGPTVGFASGLICDVLGFMVNPAGAPFLPIYTLVQGLSGLIYGIDEMGCINNGNMPLKQLAPLLYKIFGVESKDCYRFYTDIKRRKNESRTYFLDRMQEKLNERMLRDDELDRMRR